MSTVVYQETNNHFTNLDQTIADCQIETVQMFLSDEPDVNGDFDGQVGLCVGGKDVTFHVWAEKFGGWNEIALNLNEVITDEFVKVTKDNDFKVFNQSIEGNQIVTVMSGAVDPDHTIIKGNGQIYVNSETEKVWVSYGGFWYEITGGDLDGVAKLAEANNFTNLEQSIDEHAIASVKYSSTTPDKDINGYHVPKRLGSLYVMIPDDEAPEKRVRLWSSWEPHKGVFEWAEVSESPFNVKSNVENTFTAVQKYSSARVSAAGKKANMSTVISNGVNKNPSDYGKNPDHNGQMLLGWREHTPEGGGMPIASDLMLHVGVNSTWLPLNMEPVDETKLAKLDDVNQFTEITQYIGATGQKRQINTCRVKYDNISPALDTTFPAYKNGEETVWINPSAGEVSVWKAISTSETFTPTNNVWKMTWSSKDTLVRTNEENIFTKLQYLDTRSEGGEKRPFIIASRGSSVPHAQITAQVVGQLYLEQYSDTGTGVGKQFRLHFARELGNTAWECVYDSMFETNIANDLASINTELDNVAASAGQNASDITTALAELEELKTEVGGFDGRITTVEEVTSEATADIVSVVERVGTLESWRNLTIEPALETLEIDSSAAKASLENHEGRITALEDRHEQHTESLDTLHTELDAVDAKFNEDSRTLGTITGAISRRIGDLTFVGRTPYLGLQRGHVDWARVLTSYNFDETRSFDELAESHDTLSASVDNHNTIIEGHDSRISSAHSHAQNAHDDIALHDTRITALEEAPEYTLPDTVVQTDKASTMTQGLTLQTKPLVIKDTNYPRLELWMDAQHEDNNVRFGSIELNDGQFKFVGKNSSHYVQTSVLLPLAGSPTTTSTLISDGCAKFTALESFKTSAAADITDHETRIADLEAGDAGGGLSAQDLAETPHVIKGSRISDGYLELGRADGGSIPSDRMKNYSYIRINQVGSQCFLRLPPISDDHAVESSFPNGKLLTIEKVIGAQTVVSVADTAGAILQDIDGSELSLLEMQNHTRVKLVTMTVGGQTIYRIVDKQKTDLETRLAALEARLDALSIWELDFGE